MPPTTVPGVQRVTVSRTAEVAMVSISAAPGVQQTSASAWAARVACVTGVWESAPHRSFPSGALLQHASVAGGGGGGGGAGQQRSSGQPAQPCRANACLVVGRWRMRRRRASSTSAKRRRRPSRRLLTRPSRSRPAPTTRELCHGRTQGRGAACSGGCLSRRFAAALTPRAPPLVSTTKNIQTQGNGFGTFLQKFQTVTPIRRGGRRRCAPVAQAWHLARVCG